MCTVSKDPHPFVDCEAREHGWRNVAHLRLHSSASRYWLPFPCLRDPLWTQVHGYQRLAALAKSIWPGANTPVILGPSCGMSEETVTSSFMTNFLNTSLPLGSPNVVRQSIDSQEWSVKQRCRNHTRLVCQHFLSLERGTVSWHRHVGEGHC